MSNRQHYQEPPIDKQSTRVLVETVVGNKSEDIETKNQNLTRARTISGNYNRLFILGEHLKKLGVDVSDDLTIIASATRGFSKEIPDFGLIGEAIQILTLQQLPKSEKVREGGTGILRRPEPKAEE